MHGLIARAAAAVTATMALALWSCDGGSFLSEIDNNDISIALKTIEPGAFVSGEIEVTLEPRTNPENGPQDLSLLWELRVAEGAHTVLERSKSISSPDSVARLELPEDLETGLYTLGLVLRRGEREIEREERRFFHTRGEYEFMRVSSYPAAFVPDSEGILVARVKHPGTVPPFARLRFAGREYQGIVENGRFEVGLESPESEGVYLARFELFPVSPPDGSPDYEFESPVSYDHKLIVKDRPSPGLESGDPGFSRFALQGNLRDSGARPKLARDAAQSATEIGDPQFAVRDEVFGYWLEEGDGFELSDFVLPVRANGVDAFTLEFALYLPTEQSNRHVFSTVTRGENPIGVVVMLAEEGRLRLGLFSGPRHVSVEPDERIFPVSGAARVRISVEPQPDGTEISISDRRGVRFNRQIEELRAEDWELRPDELREATEEAADHPQRVGIGRTVVGGEHGFCGIIESFAAYTGKKGADAFVRSVVY